ncbi:mitogen-activated protein kinase-binding protein 1 isoform X2 [Diabrotica undecimpunctata]|uniref:mitogen-activated protein kinase-binding protein 1 isoform X2 n=1 Tax=Diabrotica undecimpunctata TaxID=50387 RepID=UPI003B63994D
MMPRNSSPIIEKEVLCTYQIKLEKVLGVTVSSNAALTCDNNGLIAYPAGCTVVFFNTRTEQQSHIINTSRKTITSLAFSACGRYIVTGECGHQPAVRVWDLQSDPQSGHPGLAPQPQQVAEFLVHKFGINCVAFSPTGKYVVSIGTQHDMIVNVWDWKSNIKVASNKVSTKVKAIAFAENGSYFVTVGNRHVKFWYLEYGNAKYKDTVPLMGRSAILGDQRNNYFCDVACGKADCADSTYVITRSGLLCEFNNRRLLDKWVELRTTSANCIAVGEKYIFVGCAEGIIRCFDPTTLKFVTTLPRNHYLGVDVSLGTSIQHMATPPQDAKYPDTVAITFDETNNKLTSVYNDHSIYVWDVFNIQRVGKSFSFLYHSACIWGVEMAPPNSPLPPGSFLTCSSDDTIRVWTLDKINENSSKGIYQPNIYSNELLRVVYVDRDLSFIKDLDISGTTEKQENTSYDGRNGVRCIRISPDGKHLASGDRAGNIRIHDLSSMREDCKIEAHDAEVLCLEYSDTSLNLMASASRDRLIHVFDMKDGYEFLQTLDDHSSSITAVRFLHHGGNTQMISCGADKSLIFRSLGELNNKPQFTRAHNATGKTTLYDMEVDTGQKHVLTACQDRNVRIYSVHNGKHTKSFKGSTGDDGTLIKVVLDRSGIYLATSCTDKSLSVYDYYSGECMATMCGHSELATGLRFTNDCRRLISASGDGCIFVWRVPHDMVVTMHARLSQQAMRQGKQLEQEVFSDSSTFDFYEGVNNVDTNYRFSIGQLPQWAKKQLTEDTSQPSSLSKGVAVPKGRWAQRAENAMGVKSFYSNQPYPFPSLDRRFDSDGGSKDSSLDSGTEIKYSETRREVTSMSKVTTRVETSSRRGIMTDDSAIGDVESNAHDGDIDSDMEYRHRPIYYPSQSGSQSGSEFTVTNIDADELRKSQRKKKTPQIMIQQATTSPTFGSNDSDDDEDEASTPSGDNTDRNPLSLFSLSSESLDQLVSRERYLQSTFESMSGLESDLQTPTNKSSISSKFLTKSSERNQEAINALKQTKNDPDAIRKRQELNKRVAETRKKLESVGHSPLKYSQSIHDLSHIPERDRRSKKQVYLDESSPDSSLRRSCSLSDLSIQTSAIPKRKIEQVTGKKSTNGVARNNSRYAKNNSITRSRSSTVLNQSDSDPDAQEKKVSRLMRPTISSHNKISNKSLQSRKKHSYSASNLITVGVTDNISTSDEDSPTAPPRSRTINFENGPTVTPRRHLNNKEKNRTARHTIHFDELLANDDFESNESYSSVEISNQVCDDLIDQLTSTAEKVVKLYDRLSEADDGNESQIDRMDKVKMSMIRTHKILHDCILKELKQNNGNTDVNQTDTVKKLNDLVSKGPSGPNNVINIMEQYSDILLDMVQQKMHSANI